MIKCYCPVIEMYIQGDIFLLVTAMQRCIIKQLSFLSKLGFISVKILKKGNV